MYKMIYKSKMSLNGCTQINIFAFLQVEDLHICVPVFPRIALCERVFYRIVLFIYFFFLFCRWERGSEIFSRVHSYEANP